MTSKSSLKSSIQIQIHVSNSRPKLPVFCNRHICCGLSAVIFLAVTLVGCCPTTTLANRNTYLVIIMFKSHVNDLHSTSKVSSQLSELKINSQLMKMGDWNQPTRLVSIRLIKGDVSTDACLGVRAWALAALLTWLVNYN